MAHISLTDRSQYRRRQRHGRARASHSNDKTVAHLQSSPPSPQCWTVPSCSVDDPCTPSSINRLSDETHCSHRKQPGCSLCILTAIACQKLLRNAAWAGLMPSRPKTKIANLILLSWHMQNAYQHLIVKPRVKEVPTTCRLSWLYRMSNVPPTADDDVRDMARSWALW